MQGERTLVIIPTYHERDNIGQLLDRLFALYPSLHILVVDDSSKDGTAEVVREVQSRHPGALELLVRQGKGGRGSAVMEGFKRGLMGPYDLLFEMDADFSHRPEEIALFFPKMQTCGMVIGSRYLPGSEIRDWGWKRTVFSHFANLYARLILRIPISDYTNGFRCYTRAAAQAVDPEHIDAKGYVVLSEVAYQLHKKGFVIGEVPTLFVNRRRGVSNLGFHEINEAFFSVLRIRWPSLSMRLLHLGTFVFRGLLGTLADLLSLWLLVRFAGVHPLPAFALSGAVAMCEMFFLRRPKWGGGTKISSTHFVLLYSSVVILTVLVASVFSLLGVRYVLAKALAIAIVAPVNYVISKKLLPR